MKTIEATELRERLEQGEALRVIDVREQDEYDGGHIPNVPLYALSAFPDIVDEIDAEGTIYVVCRSGNRSGRACEYMMSRGYDVVNVEGGMLAWDGDIEA